jgi:hypothetical protein
MICLGDVASGGMLRIDGWMVQAMSVKFIKASGGGSSVAERMFGRRRYSRLGVAIISVIK